MNVGKKCAPTAVMAPTENRLFTAISRKNNSLGTGTWPSHLATKKDTKQ